MGLIVQAGTPHVGGRGVVQELFFDGAFVEPGDGGQPAVTVAPARPQLPAPGRSTRCRPGGPRTGAGSGAAPGGELAQVQCIGLTGQPAVPGQEPRKRKPFGVGEGGPHRGQGVHGARSSSTSRPAGIREAASCGSQPLQLHSTKAPQPVTPCHNPPETGARSTSRGMLQTEYLLVGPDVCDQVWPLRMSYYERLRQCRVGRQGRLMEICVWAVAGTVRGGGMESFGWGEWPVRSCEGVLRLPGSRVLRSSL